MYCVNSNKWVNFIFIRKYCKETRSFQEKLTQLEIFLHDRLSWRSWQISSLCASVHTWQAESNKNTQCNAHTAHCKTSSTKHPACLADFGICTMGSPVCNAIQCIVKRRLDNNCFDDIAAELRNLQINKLIISAEAPLNLGQNLWVGLQCAAIVAFRCTILPLANYFACSQITR